MILSLAASIAWRVFEKELRCFWCFTQDSSGERACLCAAGRTGLHIHLQGTISASRGRGVTFVLSASTLSVINEAELFLKSAVCFVRLLWNCIFCVCVRKPRRLCMRSNDQSCLLERCRVSALGSWCSDSDRAARQPLTRVTSCADWEADDRTEWFKQGHCGPPGIRADTSWPGLDGS